MPKYPEIQFKHILEANALFRLSFYDAKWKSGVTKKKLIDLVSWPAAGRSEGHGSLSLISTNAYLKSVSWLNMNLHPQNWQSPIQRDSRWTKILIGPCLTVRSFWFLVFTKGSNSTTVILGKLSKSLVSRHLLANSDSADKRWEG